MPDLPRQITRATAAAVIALFGALGGCAPGETGPQRWAAPLAFPESAAAPRVLVYGSFGDLLPRYDATPALELFLYGPNDFGKTALRNPQGMARLGDLLLVCDQGRPDLVAINLANGQSYLWCDADHPPRCPVDVAVDAAGMVYVADTTQRSVIVYHPNRSFAAELKPPDVPAFRPAAICIVGDIAWIGDIGGHAVHRYDLHRRQWLSPLAPPEGLRLIAPTGLAVSPHGVLHVVDSVRGLVLRYAPDGQWLPPLGGPGRGPGQFVRPRSIACTPSGAVLVTDAARQSVQVFGRDGRFVTEIHERSPWTGWSLPSGIIAIAGDDPLIHGPVTAQNWPAADDYLLVSDSLGAAPLTLLGVQMNPAEVSP